MTRRATAAVVAASAFVGTVFVATVFVAIVFVGTVPSVALGAQAEPGSSYAIGHDRVEFARALHEAGYTDLAETYASLVVEHAKVDPAEASAFELLKLDVRLDQTLTGPDPLKRVQDLIVVLTGKEDAIDQNTSAGAWRSVDPRLGELYRVLAESYVAASKAATDPASLVALRDQCHEVLNRGEESMVRRIEEGNEEIGDPNLTEKQSEEYNDKLVGLSYDLGRTYYSHAVLFTGDESRRNTYLEQCLEVFEQLMLDNSDNTLSYSGSVFAGFAHRDLGQNDEALAAFDQTINARDFFWDEESKTYQVPAELAEAVAEVVGSGVLQKMLLLVQLGRQQEAIDAAKDIDQTVPSTITKGGAQGLAILTTRMEAELAIGDSAAASATARRLADLDPNGPWGARGLEVLQGSTGGPNSLDASQRLKVAKSLAAKKDYAGAVRSCQRAINAIRGAGSEPIDLASAYIFLGACYEAQAQLEDASVAYEAAAELPANDKTPDALAFAVSAYRRLYKQSRQAFFNRRTDARIQDLVTKYPEHSRSASLQFFQAQKLEDDDKLVEAAALYKQVSPGSPAYHEAQVSAGSCLFTHIIRLSREKGDPAAIKGFADEADTQLKKALSGILEAEKQTINSEEITKLKELAFISRLTLASLYMVGQVGRQAEVEVMAKEIEDASPDDPEKVAQARSLRVRALASMGKVVEAQQYLDALIQRDPDSASTASAAGTLARTLDEQAVDLFAKEKDSKAAATLWSQAFRYYSKSVEATIKGDRSRSAAELEAIANRFYIMGMYFNKVAESATSFVGWDPKLRVAPQYWDMAAKLYRIVLERAPVFRVKVNLARSAAFIGDLETAQSIYASIVEEEHVIDPTTNDLDKEAVRARPELLSVYLEYGVIEFERGKDSNSQERMLQALKTFQDAQKNSAKFTAETWWQAKYYEALTYFELGEYDKSESLVRDLERNTQGFDGGKYGLASMFEKLKAELQKRK